MSFVVEKIELHNFRSYTHANIDLSEKVTVLHGPNGSGKTNIIEALQLLSTGDSFKNPSREQQISWGKEEAKLSMFARDGLRRREVEILLNKSRRSFVVNGKGSNSQKSIRGEIPSVLFTPDDLQLIKESAEIRRNEIDSLGSLLAKRYEALSNKYKRVLTQRNKLLKSEHKDELLHEILTDQLCHLGAALIKQRVLLLSRLLPQLKAFYSKIDDKAELSLAYVRRKDSKRVSINEENFETFLKQDLDRVYEDLVEEFKQQKEKENFQKISLAGPHRDDIVFYLDGQDIRDFGSQGQQRSVVLSLKIAESLLIEEVLGKKPLLLLDDVFSELDSTRREALFDIILNFGQTVITTAHLNYLSPEVLKMARVIEVTSLQGAGGENHG